MPNDPTWREPNDKQSTIVVPGQTWRKVVVVLAVPIPETAQANQWNSVSTKGATGRKELLAVIKVANSFKSYLYGRHSRRVSTMRPSDECVDGKRHLIKWPDR